MAARPAGAVSRVLRAAGIPVGYRYRQTGYVDRDGRKVDVPGAEVTRLRRSRYSGMEDAGHVAVYLIDPSRVDLAPSPELLAQAEAALRAAGMPVGRRGTFLFVDDEAGA